MSPKPTVVKSVETDVVKSVEIMRGIDRDIVTGTMSPKPSVDHIRDTFGTY